MARTVQSCLWISLLLSKYDFRLWVLMCWFMPITGLVAAGDAHPGACPPGCTCKDIRSVDCSRMNLTTLPEGINTFVTKLDLGFNNISHLPDFAFSNFTELHELRLSENHITTLSRTVFHGLGNSLEMLYLDENELRAAPKEAFNQLTALQQLHLGGNRMERIPDSAFQGLHALRGLWLEDNQLTGVPTAALAQLKALEGVTMTSNRIKAIDDYAFRNLSALQVLVIKENEIHKLEDKALDGLTSLSILELDYNEIPEFPVAIGSLTKLEKLGLMHNRIQFLPDNSLANNKQLSVLRLKNNPLMSFGKYAFSGLPHLTTIIVSEARDQTEFPDLTGSVNLEQLELDRAAIKSIPRDLCTKLPRMTRLDVHSNRISRLPDFTHCADLHMLSLGNNDLSSVEGKPFDGLVQLKDLILSHNFIEIIPADAFQGLVNLQYLDLQHNKITYISPEAFAPLSSLEDLNLGENTFSVLPSKGLDRVKNLKTFNNRQLKDFVSKDALPSVQLLILSYAYHCCEFMREAEEAGSDGSSLVSEQFIWLEPSPGDPDPSLWRHEGNLTPVWGSLANDTSYYRSQDDVWGNYDYPLVDSIALPPSVGGSNISDYFLANPVHHPVSCKPMPGPFMPCDDLMGWWSLRCGVWIVFLLALLGNGTVLFIILFSQRKMDVPRFLICNLASADLMMGVYLGFLAVVDALTLGEFKKHAIRWQTSPGCQVAGFLGVLSSELSVFILTIITLERFYAITHAMHLNKRLSLRHAGYIVACCWLLALLLAVLPLFGVSDYRKFAVCLPFETSDKISLGYVCFIMFINLVAFGIIVSCYSKMYCSVRGSQAWNSNDSRIAKRMALLVFTDFACWAPISFFSITAAFGLDLLSLNDAKVFTIFVLPLNSCANPFLYAILTKQFKKDCAAICKRLEESAMNRSLSRLSNRNVSLTWGSSRRPSLLNSFFNSEPRKGRNHSALVLNGRVAHRHLMSANLALRETVYMPPIKNSPRQKHGDECGQCCQMYTQDSNEIDDVSDKHDVITESPRNGDRHVAGCPCTCHALVKANQQAKCKGRGSFLLGVLKRRHPAVQHSENDSINEASSSMLENHNEHLRGATKVMLAPPGESLDPAKNPHFSPRTSPGGVSARSARSKCSPSGKGKSTATHLKLNCYQGNARTLPYSQLTGASLSETSSSEPSVARQSDSSDLFNNNHEYINVTEDMISELQHLREQSTSSSGSSYAPPHGPHGNHTGTQQTRDVGLGLRNQNVRPKVTKKAAQKHRSNLKRPEPEGSETTKQEDAQTGGLDGDCWDDRDVCLNPELLYLPSVSADGAQPSQNDGALPRPVKKAKSSECCNRDDNPRDTDSASVPLLTPPIVPPVCVTASSENPLPSDGIVTSATGWRAANRKTAKLGQREADSDSEETDKLLPTMSSSDPHSV